MNHPIISIIGGTGKEGSGLASRWAAAGYKIIIGSRQAEKARESAKEINLRLGLDIVIGMDNHQAIEAADICVLTVIQSAHDEILENLKDRLRGKILVDATSRVDFRNPRPPDPPSAAQHAQDLLGPSVRVVAAFQNVSAKSLTRGIGQSLDADILICSDDIQAAEMVIKLAYAAGMRGYYAGLLANATVVEGLTSILISINKYYGIKDASLMITGLPKQ
jgi:8-hydroxy-5-deazaflavin:NADPH oxidoreductase